jgi:hypothetical protein
LTGALVRVVLRLIGGDSRFRFPQKRTTRIVAVLRNADFREENRQLHYPRHTTALCKNADGHRCLMGVPLKKTVSVPGEWES